MKHYLNETVAFIADIHTITKIKVRKTVIERRGQMEYL